MGYPAIENLASLDRRDNARALHAARRPKAGVRLAAFGGDVRVDAKSLRWLHRLVYDRALALKRDIHTDFPQWCEDGPPRASRGDRESDLHALLLVENEVIPVGAVSFSLINWKDAAPVGT